MAAVSYQIWVDNESTFRSSNEHPWSWMEAIQAYKNDPSMVGRKLTLKVVRGNDLIDSEEVTL